MTSYRYLVPPPARTDGDAGAAGFAFVMAERLRTQAKGRHRTEGLVEWEGEGGNLAAPPVDPKSS